MFGWRILEERRGERSTCFSFLNYGRYKMFLKIIKFD